MPIVSITTTIPADDAAIAATAKGLDAAGRLIRDMESDATHLGLSGQDAAALRVASALLAAVQAAIDGNSSRHHPTTHLDAAIKTAVGIKY
jgi:hypothetical protein